MDTPYLALDLHKAAERYEALSRALPAAAIHYAVKANPHPMLLAQLVAQGASFDVASAGEVDLACAAGARPSQLIYSNPIKKREDIAHAWRLGVDCYVVDSAAEVDKIADVVAADVAFEGVGSHNPRAVAPAILARLSTSGVGADYPLSGKFGASAAECVEMLLAADARGLRAAGVSFHVGSQQRNVHAWAEPLAGAAQIFEVLRSRDLDPWLVDVGGGFPASLAQSTPDFADYGAAIRTAMESTFGNRQPNLVLEPGRGLVADAGVLVARVIGVADRADGRWVYLDAGVFTGLVETIGAAIRYRITTPRDADPMGSATLAGPSCDSSDVLYRAVGLPLTLAEGDLVEFHGTGAYTTAYATVNFNGFAPLQTAILGEALTTREVAA